jgi:hypothetical protein
MLSSQLYLLLCFTISRYSHYRSHNHDLSILQRKTYDARHAGPYAPALTVGIEIGVVVPFATSGIVGTAGISDALETPPVLHVGVRTGDLVLSAA